MASLNPEDDVQFDTAFQSLLDQRNKDTFVDSFGEPSIQGEDALLCNTNLQTAVLFKNLTKQYSDLSAALAKEKDDTEQMMNSVISYKQSFKDIFNLYLKEMRTSDAIKSLQEKNDIMTKEVDLILKRFSETSELTVLTLEKKIDDTSRKLNLIRETIMMGIQGIIKPDDMIKKMCPVCFDREVDTVLVPCGHTYCSGCSEYDRSHKCPQCRAPVQRRIKIYFSI
jgi:hypothetical protein